MEWTHSCFQYLKKNGMPVVLPVSALAPMSWEASKLLLLYAFLNHKKEPTSYLRWTPVISDSLLKFCSLVDFPQQVGSVHFCWWLWSHRGLSRRGWRPRRRWWWRWHLLSAILLPQPPANALKPHWYIIVHWNGNRFSAIDIDRKKDLNLWIMLQSVPWKINDISIQLVKFGSILSLY